MSDTEIRPDEQLARARDAFERMAWEDAFEGFSEDALTSSLEASDLETWASTGYLLGRIDTSLDAVARAYQAHLDAEAPEDAARKGFWIVFILQEQGEIAQASGWFSRSSRLLETIPPQSTAHGYMLALEAYRLVAVDPARTPACGATIRGTTRTARIVTALRRRGLYDPTRG